MARNIVGVYELATDGARTAGAAWYPAARMTAAELADRHGLELETAVGIIATLSPRTDWASNVDRADRCMAAIAAGTELPRVHTDAMMAHVARIAAGVPALVSMQARKTRAFHRCIMGETTGADDGAELAPVCVDAWAARIATNDPKHKGPKTPKQYDAMAAAYREAAAYLTMPAAELQAATWVAIRGTAD